MRKARIGSIALLVISALSFHAAAALSQYDGGMLCGGEGSPPYWLLRFEVVDQDTHAPIPGARIRIREQPDGFEMVWSADREGVAVLVASDPRCIPGVVSLEITHPLYAYHEEEIVQWDLVTGEDERRILLDGHMHNWTDENALPSTQELIDKVRARRYRVGVRQVPTEYGFSMQNYAPALYEYAVELARVRRGRGTPERGGPDRLRRPTDYGPEIPTVTDRGVTIGVFPNDLSGGSYYWQRAINACRQLGRLGHDDWHLPSRTELGVLFDNRHIIGGFGTGWYWSSTERSGSYIWVRNFGDGTEDMLYKGSTYDVHKGSLKVRCVRQSE